jgi:hypothetical protein
MGMRPGDGADMVWVGEGEEIMVAEERSPVANGDGVKLPAIEEEVEEDTVGEEGDIEGVAFHLTDIYCYEIPA